MTATKLNVNKAEVVPAYAIQPLSNAIIPMPPQMGQNPILLGLLMIHKPDSSI